MRTLSRALSRQDSSGKKLPKVYRALPALRSANLTVIAGAPGSGKTILTANLIKQMGLPTLYVSPDSDEHTMGSRLLALYTGETTDVTEAWLDEWPENCARKLHESCDFIRWIFSGADLDSLWLEVEAWEEMWGDFPRVIVVDVLLSLGDDTGDSSSVREIVKALVYLARLTNAAVLAVSHTSESHQQACPPPMSAVMYKTNQLPAMIWTIQRGPYEQMLVAVVKYRNGPSDPSGKTYTALPCDYARSLVTEKT